MQAFAVPELLVMTGMVVLHFSAVLDLEVSPSSLPASLESEDFDGVFASLPIHAKAREALSASWLLHELDVSSSVVVVTVAQHGRELDSAAIQSVYQNLADQYRLQTTKSRLDTTHPHESDVEARARIVDDVSGALKENSNSLVILDGTDAAALSVFHRCWDTDGWIGDGRITCKKCMFLVELNVPEKASRTIEDAIHSPCSEDQKASDNCYNAMKAAVSNWIKECIAANDQTTKELEGDALLRRIKFIVPLFEI